MKIKITATCVVDSGEFRGYESKIVPGLLLNEGEKAFDVLIEASADSYERTNFKVTE